MATDVEQAQQIRTAAAEAIERINGNADVTPDARARQVAQIRDDANGRIEALRAEHDSSIEAERRKLERRLFAAPSLGSTASASDRIAQDASFRDALDRARRVPAEDMAALTALLGSAELVGDSLQSRAVLVIAFERNNLDALRAYLDAHPDEADALNRLYDLRDGPSIRDVVATAFAFGGV